MRKCLNLYIIFMCTILLGFSGCTKLPKDTPKCVADLIKTNKSKSDCLSRVYKYSYLGREVYLFIDDANKCFDACAYLLDENCSKITDNHGKIICQCNWGQTINCQDFYDNRTGEELIWKH